MARPDIKLGQLLTLPPDSDPVDKERLSAVNQGLDRIYQSDEFAEAVARQASGEAEVIYDTADPNDPDRQPLFTDGQVVLVREDVAYGFHPEPQRGVDISPSIEGQTRRITNSLWTSGSEAGGILTRPSHWHLREQGDLTAVELTSREALGVLQTVVNVFSEPRAAAPAQ
ncbi:MAG: hypothetical protein HY426_00470 [Candidatus Levybacteria bacterium]|nr:hypothetical protein [Candidatus Levybacteria bacterium]